MTDLDEPITHEGQTWATYAMTSELTGVPQSTLAKWVQRGHITTVHSKTYGVLLCLDDAQDRERQWRRHGGRTTPLGPLAVLLDAPTLPC